MTAPPGPQRWAIVDESARLRQAARGSEAQALLDDLERSCGRDQACLATVQIGRALDQAATGKAPKAVGAAEQARKVFEKARDGQGIGRARLCLGILHLKMGDGQRALAELQPARTQLAKTGDRTGEGDALLNVGNALSKKGDRVAALATYREALAMFQRNDDAWRVAKAETNIGLVMSAMGDQEAALVHLGKGLEGFTSAGDVANTANVHLNFGTAREALGQWKLSIEAYAAALVLYQRAGNPDGVADALLGEGNVWYRLGDIDAALDRYQRALAVQREAGSRAAQAQIQNNVGEVLRAKGRPADALVEFKQALDLAKATKQCPLEGAIEANIGDAKSALGRHAEAVGHFRTAIDIARTADDREGKAQMLADLGSALAASGDERGALRELDRALSLSREIKSRATEADASYRIARILRDTSLERAILHAKESVNVYQSLRGDAVGVGTEGEKTYARSISGAYRLLAELLVRDSQLVEAQMVLDLLKEDELKRLLNRGDPGGTEMRFTDTEKTLKGLIQQATTLQADADGLEGVKPRTSAQSASLAELEAKLAGQRAAVEAFSKGLAAGRAERHRLRHNRAKEDAAVVDSHLDVLRDTVFVYTVAANDRVILIVYGRENFSFNAEYLISSSELAGRVDALRKAMRAPGSNEREAAAAVWNVLVGPIQDALKAAKPKTILWSLDGVLRYVPIAALWDAKAERWVSQQYENVVITTSSFINLSKAPSPDWAVSAFGMSQASPPLPALTYVPSELRAIVRNEDSPDGVLPGKKTIDPDFTLSALARELTTKPRPKVVHIATHYVFRPPTFARAGDEDGSYLLLGKGKLTLKSFSDWGLGKLTGIDLITFSACDTATGGDARELTGAEVDGLAMVAQQMGAAAVIATLWSVNDPATAAFMSEFYRLRQAEKLTKAEALRRVQLSFIEGKVKPDEGGGWRGLERPEGATGVDWSHPFYWAPFMLLGNPL